MRYRTDHKDESHARILRAAAAQYRSAGTGVSVADIMAAAGLTHGGFYKHFSDKDQLLQEAIATALTEIAERIESLTAGMTRPKALEAVIDFYLSEQHVRHPDVGCALAALGTDMARMSPAMKREIGKALDAYADRLGYLMPGDTADDRAAAFRVLFASMAGCVMTARALGSDQKRRALLANSRAFFTRATRAGLTTPPAQEPA
jgi:TetR/AcrR family transcriptional repressor of nem operon